jgi:hypothetical protein
MQVLTTKSKKGINKNSNLNAKSKDKISRNRKSDNVSKKMVQSQPLLAHKPGGARGSFQAKEKPRNRKINLIPIELESFSSKESEEESSIDSDMDRFRKPIETLEQFLGLFGAQIDSQSSESLLISIINKSASVTIPRSVFNGYWIKWNNADRIKYQPLQEHLIDTIESKEIQPENHQEFDNESPILNNRKYKYFYTLALNIENLRIADDMTTDRKNNISTIEQDVDLKRHIELPDNNNFAAIFGNLEGMDGDSTLMGGFDNDDDDDTPPPLVPARNLPINQK